MKTYLYMSVKWLNDKRLIECLPLRFLLPNLLPCLPKEFEVKGKSLKVVDTRFVTHMDEMQIILEDMIPMTDLETSKEAFPRDQWKEWYVNPDEPEED